MGTAKNCRWIPSLTGTGILSMILCLSLTVSALAVFWDRTGNENNRIETGSLSSALWCSDQLSSDGALSNRRDLSDPTNKLFDGVSWFPGKQCVRYLQVENTGTLPLSYRILFSFSDQGLGERLFFSIRPLEGCGGSLFPSGFDTAVTGNQLDSLWLENQSLPPKEGSREIYEITCRIEDWDARYGRESPDLLYNLDITLLSTQTGINQAGGVVLVSSFDDLLTVSPFGTAILAKDLDVPQQDLILEHPINFDLNGHTLTVQSLWMRDSSRKGRIGLRSGTILTTGQVPGQEYGVVIDAPLSSVHFSNFTGRVLANQVIYVDGAPLEDAAAPPETEGVYHLSTESHLRWLSQQVNAGETFINKEFQFLNDIDLQSREWTPIGALSSERAGGFAGILNGNGFSVRNLFIHQEGKSELGFFGALSGTVRNLTLDGVSVTGSDRIGALAGNSNGLIENCTVRNARLKGRNQAGGLAGSVSGPVKSCSVLDSTLSGTGSQVGGLAGATAEGDFSLSNCSVSGCSVTGAMDTGGLVGLKDCSVSISGCSVVNGTVSIDALGSTQSAYCGGLVGRARELYLYDPSESDSQYSKNVTGNQVGADVAVHASGANAYANQYNSYTGILEPIQW